jgi:hypothetical protein
MRESRWLFPAIEGIHLIGFALIGGAVLVVDLRLLGFGLWRQPTAQIAQDAQRWFLISFLGIVVPSGSLLFMSQALKCYYYQAFWVKMTLLPLALIFTFTFHRRVAMGADGYTNPWWNRLVAVISLSLWAGVGIAGRAIGFS